MELTVIRHGQTPGNAARRYVGAIDEPLSAEGRRQAQEAGPYPAVRRVYVSPMARARETASIIFPHAEQVVVEGVQEMNFGVFGGRSADDMADDPAYRAWVESGCESRCPGGESRAEFTGRVVAAIEHLCRESVGRGEERVVLVAHGGTMMAACSHFAPGKREYYEWLTDNCGCRRFRVSLSGAGELKIEVLG